MNDQVSKAHQVIDQINIDRRRIRATEPLPITILTNDGQTSRIIDGDYLHFQRLIDVVLKIKAKPHEMNEFIQYCRQEHRGNEATLSKITRFEECYNKENALLWYTEEPFIYERLNLALRTRRIDIILLFAFFIRDLDEGLRFLHQHQPKVAMKLYRGQWMSKGELERIRSLTNQLISINSFLSTSCDLGPALMFLDPGSNSDPSRERVLFEIEVGTHLHEGKSFANIASISSFPQEEEVLFAINSIFKIKSVEQEVERTVIRLLLCNADEHKLKDVEAFIRSNQNEDLLALGDVLLDMGQWIEAERYYVRIFDELQPDELAIYYNHRGIIAGQLGNHKQSIEYFKIALLKTDPTNRFDFAGTCHNMGIAFEELNDQTTALYCFENAIRLYLKVSDPERYCRLAQCYRSVGVLYANKNNYEEAIENFTFAVKIQLKVCPDNYQDLALSFMNICNSYADLGQYEKVVEYYDKSLMLYLDSLPHDHPDLAQLYHNMARTFEEIKDYSRAIVALEKMLSLHLETYPPTDLRAFELQQDIERVRQKQAQAVGDA